MIADKTVDDLGRVQIPKAIREELGIEAGDKVLVFINSNLDIVVSAVKQEADDGNG